MVSGSRFGHTRGRFVLFAFSGQRRLVAKTLPDKASVGYGLPGTRRTRSPVDIVQRSLYCLAASQHRITGVVCTAAELSKEGRTVFGYGGNQCCNEDGCSDAACSGMLICPMLTKALIAIAPSRILLSDR